MYVIEVAELCSLDNTVEGGFKIDCTTMEEVNRFVANLEAGKEGYCEWCVLQNEHVISCGTSENPYPYDEYDELGY